VRKGCDVLMINSAEEFIALRLSNDPEMYNKSAHDSASVEVWRDVIADYPNMKRWVAHNKTVPLDILRILADDPDPDVRMTVAMKRKCDAALFEKLANDPHMSVRLAVAFNAKTPKEILQRLSRDSLERVAEIAAARLKPD
jgi:hypothetical protein